MTTVGYTPISNQDNAYINRCISILQCSYEVSPLPRTRHILKYLFAKKFQRLDFAITNWEDTWIISKSSGYLSFFGTINFTIRLLSLRFIARKVVFVRHDRFPHQTCAAHAYAAYRLLNIIEHLASIVITHSPCETYGRRHYVPHPLYRTPVANMEQSNNDDNAQSYFIIFGRLLPYKGIDSLIKSFPEDQHLLLVGPCNDSAYHAQLQELCRGKPNIELHAQYINEELASELVRNAKAVLLTNTGMDMIVSGSYFFAISNAVPVIAIESKFYHWSVSINHAPGLIVCQNMNEMLRAIANFSAPSWQEIANYATTNFGDEAVRHAWCAALQTAPEIE